MNEEEKEAIEWLKAKSNEYVIKSELDENIEIAINLISKLQKELDKKNKRIKQLETDNKVLEQSLWEEGKGKYGN